MPKTKNCPCCSQQSYDDCCGQYIEVGKAAPTPEALMRSRYSAYTQAKIDYIERTMTGPAAMGFNPVEARKWAKSVRWVRLEVVSAHEQGDKGEVSFKAFYTLKNKPHVLSERSFFERINGQWKYVDGIKPT